MVASLPLPSFEELSEYYKYEPDTGDLILLKQRCKADKEKIGKKIGSKGGPARRQTWVVKHKGKSYYISRIAWLLMTKQDPGKFLIEHKNRNALDNSWSNLRIADESQNNYNKISLGYHKRKDYDLYRVRLTVKGKRLTIGHFATEEEAKQAVKDARLLFYREFACLDLE